MVLVSAMAAAFAAAGAALPLALGVDVMAGGLAAAFVGGVLSVCGIAASLVFAARALSLARLLRGEEVLVHWTYPDIARATATAETSPRDEDARGVGPLVVVAFALALGGCFWLLAPSVGRGVFFGFVGLALVVCIAAGLAPRMRRARRARAIPEAALSLEGAYVVGSLHAWGLLGARIESAEVTATSVPRLQVTYSSPVPYGRRETVVTIPIPPGEEERASEAARALLRSVVSSERW
jgi:hypothetical protein